MKFESFGVILLICIGIASAALPYATITAPKDEERQIGESVLFKCEFEGSESPRFVYWMNDSEIITNNRDVFGDPRASIQAGTSMQFNLLIEDLELTDEGSYECQAPGSGRTLKIHHTLTIVIPPSIEASPEEDNVKVSEGEDLTLSCIADGKPDPTVTWTYRSDSGAEKSPPQGEEWELEDITRDDSGTYTCTADNGVAPSVVEVFQVDVQFAPTVTGGEPVWHTGPGDTVSLQCIFTSNPAPQVIWTFNGEDLEMPDVRSYDSGRHEFTSVLTLTDLQTSELGRYECQGANDKGKISAAMELSGLPYGVEFTSEPEGMYSDVYTLSWEFSSVADPTQCQLEITDSNGTEFGSNVVPATINGRYIHAQSYRIENLSIDSEYSASVNCENSIGETGWSEEFKFRTSQDENQAPPPITIPDPVEVPTTTPEPSTDNVDTTTQREEPQTSTREDGFAILDSSDSYTTDSSLTTAEGEQALGLEPSCNCSRPGTTSEPPNTIASDSSTLLFEHTSTVVDSSSDSSTTSSPSSLIQTTQDNAVTYSEYQTEGLVTVKASTSILDSDGMTEPHTTSPQTDSDSLLLAGSLSYTTDTAVATDSSSDATTRAPSSTASPDDDSKALDVVSTHSGKALPDYVSITTEPSFYSEAPASTSMSAGKEDLEEEKTTVIVSDGKTDVDTTETTTAAIDGAVVGGIVVVDPDDKTEGHDDHDDDDDDHDDDDDDKEVILPHDNEEESKEHEEDDEDSEEDEKEEEGHGFVGRPIQEPEEEEKPAEGGKEEREEEGDDTHKDVHEEAVVLEESDDKESKETPAEEDDSKPESKETPAEDDNSKPESKETPAEDDDSKPVEKDQKEVPEEVQSVGIVKAEKEVKPGLEEVDDNGGASAISSSMALLTLAVFILHQLHQ